MFRLTSSVVMIVAVSGCAGTSQWRTLQIDGTAQPVFEESLARLNEELPYSRQQMFAMALVDIVETSVRDAGITPEAAGDGVEAAYTQADFRAQLDGLTYDGVIALADQSGPAISQLYLTRRMYAAPPPSGGAFVPSAYPGGKPPQWMPNGQLVPAPGSAEWGQFGGNSN